MTTHKATVQWARGQQRFVDNRYSRAHTWTFDGGAVVPGSASPHVVPMPYADARGVDPEEAFIASVSSCHMLWFLSIAAKRGFRVDDYVDEAIGTMGPNAEGKLAMTRIVLHPRVSFSSESRPRRNDVEAMHHEAHAECFIANSVRTEILCEPVED